MVLGGVCVAICSWLVVAGVGPVRGTHRAGIQAVPRARASSTLTLGAQPPATEPSIRAAVRELVPLAALPPFAAAVLQPTTSVWGSVRDVVGAPIGSDARVAFVDRSGRLRPCDVADDGEFALQSLAQGTHWVTVNADGYRGEGMSIELSADRPRLRLNFTLQKAVQLRVQIATPEGGNPLDLKAARQLVPVATREPLEARYGESHVATMLVGRFQARDSCSQVLPAECIGVLTMDDDQPAWVSLLHESAVIQTRRVETGQDAVAFLIRPEELLSRKSAVRVRVLDALTGRPLHRARVTISSGGDPERDAITDEHGFATAEGRAASSYELLIRARTYAELRLSVDVPQTGGADVETIALEPEVTVAGLVLDLDGRPRAATFSLGTVDPTDRSLRWSSGASMQSRHDGSFLIRGLGRREYVIRTSDDDRLPGADWKGIATVSGNVVLDTRGGSIAGLEVRVRPASRLVLHASGSTGTAASFRVLDEHGLEVAKGFLHGSEPRALELPPGVYRVASLPAGDGLLADQTIELGSDIVTLDLTRR